MQIVLTMASKPSSAEFEEFQKFKDGVGANAEDKLKDLFPRKAMELEELLKTFPPVDFSSTESELGLRGGEPAESESKRLGPMCTESNEKIVKIIEQMKPEIIFVIEQLNSLKIWITLNIPKTQDGNNFGVGIQSETVSELQRIEADVAALYETIPQYYISRARLVSLCLKFPQVEDHRRSVQLLDLKEMENLYMTCTEIRNIYCCLHDMLLKNLEKLKKPRSALPNMMMY